MSELLQDVFADTAFWIALAVKQDQCHERAQKWSTRIGGRIVTTTAVFLETANALARLHGARPRSPRHRNLYSREAVVVVRNWE